MTRSVVFLVLVAFCGCPAQQVLAARYDGKLTIRVLDQDTGQPIPAKMELRNSRGRPVRVRPSEAVAQDNYFVFDGQVTLELRRGEYQFLIEAGPEYQTRPGNFRIDKHAEDTTAVTLKRRVNMQAEGWWAGDLDVRLRADVLPELMRGTRVNLVPVLQRENIRGKCKATRLPRKFVAPTSGVVQLGPRSALDYRRGGGLLLFDVTDNEQLLAVCGLTEASAELSVQSAEDPQQTVVAMTPFAWDLPIWIAAGKLDAVQIIHRHALVDDAVDNEGWGRERDTTFYPGKPGNGRWSETIYHHLLNCGLQLPPAAGSGAGANENPVGTNRVYVQCGQDFSIASWLEGLRAGKVIVTNGPLLRTRVAGEPPGHQFNLSGNEVRDFQISLDLAFYEKAPVEYLEILKNGRVEHEIRLDELAKKQGRLPPLQFDESGWFVVRAMTSTLKNYQYATTGPYYVVANNQPRISRKSVQFFLDWLTDAREQFADLSDVVASIDAAENFWRELLDDATTD
ncbi:MAG: hypothetical protein AAGD11_15270 [Planctomycetota bacterium]